jgi:hypothetical protein
VTTDGFITDIENLERKIIGGKAYFISQLKNLERKIIDDNNFLIKNSFINVEFLKEEVNKQQNLNLILIEKIQKVITQLN